MNKRFLKNVSVSTLQLLLNQSLGLLIFYQLSRFLDKDSFGELNWSLAVMFTAYTVLSCGIDQVIVRKIAAGEPVPRLLSLYMGHVLISGAIFYGLVFISHWCFPAFFKTHDLLLLIGVAKLFLFFSTPFKQLANGLERFRALLYMSVCSNVVRSLSLLVLPFIINLSLWHVVIIFMVGDTLELVLSYIVCRKGLKIPLRLQWYPALYRQLVKESLPQVGVVLFTSALARFDWIFIGLFISAGSLAEYSFAYKAFEVSTLPLLAVAPVLVPTFTGMFRQLAGDATTAPSGHIPDLRALLRAEMVVASLAGLLLNLCWVPVMDPITHGKYGIVNVPVVFWLSLCMPLLYMSNFLWSLLFANGELKAIFYTIAVSFFINVTGDVVLIPLFKNQGAAAAFVLGMLAQCILYMTQVRRLPLAGSLHRLWVPLVVCPACALASGLTLRWLIPSPWLVAGLSVVLYFFLLVLARQLRKQDAARLLALASRKG